MHKLTRQDLYSLEQYAVERAAFRARVMAHKRPRRVALGDHAALYFEDRYTVQYQIQEMLRVERIFEPAAIADELAAYNPLIPDGRNWKATFMLEYADAEARGAALAQLLGIEHRLWVRVAELPAVFGIADEDLPRATADKTSAVHFVRFELTAAMAAAAKAGAPIAVGVDHVHYRHALLPVADTTRAALVLDLA